MLSCKALLSLFLLGLSIAAASPLTRNTGKATLNFATRIDVSGAQNVAEKDRARAQALKNAIHSGKRAPPVSISVTNAALTYTAQVRVGDPATDYTLLIDTGSSNTWVGASRAYVQTSTSYDTGNSISVSYGLASFFGEEWIDEVALGPGLVIPEQSIGVASSAAGFTGVDGILGIGPVDLTSSTVNNTNTVPTVVDNLFSQGTISEEVLGIFYVPASESTSTGELTFGGYDHSVVTSSVTYVPITTTSPASQYWGIDQSISYLGRTLLSNTAGIVDTGTTLILIATDAFERYQSVTGGVLDNVTGLLTITPSQYSRLKPLLFRVGSTEYALSANAQIWPRSLNTAINGSSGSIYLIVSDIGSPSGSGLDFINGYAFLEHYYSVYDTTNGRVGFATTKYTRSTAN